MLRTVWFLSACSPYHRLSRSIIVIQAIHAHLQCGRLLCGDKELFWRRGDGDRRRWGKVNWLGRYFCWLEPSLSVTIISVISSSAAHFCCILGQTNALCMFVCVQGSACYLTHSQLLYLIGYMQIGPKLQATCKGTPHGTVLYTQTHTHPRTQTYITRYDVFSLNLQLSQWWESMSVFIPIEQRSTIVDRV